MSFNKKFEKATGITISKEINPSPGQYLALGLSGHLWGIYNECPESAKQIAHLFLVKENGISRVKLTLEILEEIKFEDDEMELFKEKFGDREYLSKGDLALINSGNYYCQLVAVDDSPSCYVYDLNTNLTFNMLSLHTIYIKQKGKSFRQIKLEET